jgi:hypothetical protein
MVAYAYPSKKKWSKGYRFDTTIHCEVALATLVKYANDVSIQHYMQDHPSLLGCLQVGFANVIMTFINLTEEQNIDQQTIHMSKLCCAACWETMKGPNDRFGGYGWSLWANSGDSNLHHDGGQKEASHS